MRRIAVALVLTAGALAQEPSLLLGPGDYRWVPLRIHQAPVRVDVAFEVLKGDATVHAEIVPESAFRPMQKGLAHDALGATPAGVTGTLQATIGVPGIYRVVLVNGNGAKPAIVTWRVSTDLNPAPIATELPPKRRIVTIAVSFLLFFALVGYSGWRLRKSAQS